MGVTGNSALYTNYLKTIGAAMNDTDGNTIKDNVKGSQCWCPITNLDTADAAYEWNMGQYFSTGTRAEGTFTKSLSRDLTNAYVEYVNNIKLKDSDGNELTLTDTNAGTYYDYLLSVITESLNNFLSDTSFPYTPSSSTGGSGMRNIDSTTYETASDYIDSLNSDETWIIYNSTSNTATISSVEAFVTHCKSASKDVGAFDSFSLSQAENKLFGISGSTYTKHFDSILATLLTNNATAYSALTNWDSTYPTNYTNDLTVTDSLSNTIKTRVNIYNPMYYLNSYYEGYKTSDVADYFRINSGITQGDTSNVVEMNLYLALQNIGKNVSFTTVWEQGHTQAERSGDADKNFICWIAGIEGVTCNITSSKDQPSFPGSINNTNSTSSSSSSTSTSGTTFYKVIWTVNVMILLISMF